MINRCKIKAGLKERYKDQPQQEFAAEKTQYIRVWKKADGIEQAFKRAND